MLRRQRLLAHGALGIDDVVHAEPLKDADLTVLGLGHDHVKAVGAQVDGGDQGQILGLGLRHG